MNVTRTERFFVAPERYHVLLPMNGGLHSFYDVFSLLNEVERSFFQYVPTWWKKQKKQQNILKKKQTQFPVNLGAIKQSLFEKRISI